MSTAKDDAFRTADGDKRELHHFAHFPYRFGAGGSRRSAALLTTFSITTPSTAQTTIDPNTPTYGGSPHVIQMVYIA